MGEWLKQVPVKLPDWAIEEIDGLVAADPLQHAGRSTVIRNIVERFLDLMSCGMVGFAASDCNGVRGVRGIQSIPAENEEFPAVSVAGKRPPVRSIPPGSRTDRGRVSGINRRDYVDHEVARAYASPSFPAMHRYGNSSTYGVAA